MTVRRFIVGPPGCGKTYKAKEYVEQITNVNLRGRVLPSEVALVSFTNAAAQTLAGRGIPVPRQNIGTLHSFAFRALGYNTEQVAESKIDDFNKAQTSYNLAETKKKPSPEYDAPGDGPVGDEGSADDLLNKYNIMRAKMTRREFWRADVRAFAARWESWKEENGLIDFSDMIENALLEIDEMPGNPAVIIADEAQDFAPLELKLLEKWADRANIVNYIGDPDQILYQFKGVDPDAFKVLSDNAFKQVLSQSYRVPAAVHKLAVKWIERLVGRDPIEYFPTEEPGRVGRTHASFKEPESLIKIINRAVADGRDVMIMASCTYMLEPIVALLRREGIPFWNPNRKTNGAWNPLDGGGTTASARLLAYLRPDEATWGDMARFWTGDDLKKWTEVIKAEGNFIRGAKKAIGDLDADSVLDFKRLLNWFSDFSLGAAYELDLSWFKNNLTESKAKSFSFPLAIAEKHGARKLLEPRRVKVGTIHSFKGDEADLVIVFPDLSMRGYNEWLTTGGRPAILRQFYVAYTRTKDELLLCDATSNMAVGV